MIWLGAYDRGVASGLCWKSVLGRMWMVGYLDTSGEFTGDNIATIYPDLKTALVGKYLKVTEQ